MENNIDINVLYEVALNKIMQLERENIELNALLIQSSSIIKELEEKIKVSEKTVD